VLELPPQWRSCCTRFVVSSLLRRADAIGQYPEAASAVLRSALEFMLSGPRWGERQRRAFLMPHPKGWRINDSLFYLLKNANDNTMVELSVLPRSRLAVNLIAPPSTEWLVQCAVKAILPDFRINVYSIDSYIDLRTLWTRLDMGMEHSDALASLLERYSQLTQFKPSISIDSPNR
jgi:hypothetical protein